MPYVTKQDDISVLPMSGRSLNCLRRIDIHTIGAMMEYPTENLTDIRSIGKKVIEEIQDWISNLSSGSGEYLLVEYDYVASNTEAAIENYEVTENSEITTDVPDGVVRDISVNDFPLSIRAKNCLIRNGYEYASQLVGMTYTKLMGLPKMGKVSAEAIMAYLETTLLSQDSSSDIEASSIDTKVASEISAIYGETVNYWLKEILSVKAQHPEAMGETLMYHIYDSPLIRGATKAKILSLIESNENECSKHFLEEHLPLHLINTTIIEEILLELETSSAIEMTEIMIYRQYPSVLEYVATISDDRVREVIQGRIGGKTLQELGDIYSVSRERVRQLTQKGLKQKPILREDKYAKIFETYDFSLEDFLIAFSEPNYVYNYLDMICPVTRSKRKHIEESLTDVSIPPKTRKQIERAVYKQYATIEGLRVKKTRPELVKFMVKTFCKSLTRMEDFASLYQEKLNELGLGNDPLLVIDTQTCKNAIVTSNYALWNQWNSFRYYNIPEHDFTELLSTICLDRYENLEISTLKLFRDYPELMQQYDIRDEYELHNLLRKIWPQEICAVNFLRMPTIEIGTADREGQILSLLLQYSPISADDLSAKYEEAYGVKASTIRGGLLKAFNSYFYDGVYSIDYAALPTIQFNRMKSILNRDYYTIQDATRLYKREFPNSSASLINPYTLKTLGFHVYPGCSGYIVKNTFPSSSDYFNYLLTSNDVVDLRDYEYSLRNNKTFRTEHRRLRMEYEIVEFAPSQLIHFRRLNANGITKKDLTQYCCAVAHNYEKGEYFTVTSLRKDGFEHSLDDLGFDEWFYASILYEDQRNFSAQKIGGTRLFLRGKTDGNFSGMLTWLLEKYQKIDIYELLDLLQSHYGISVPKRKIIDTIDGTELYYDTIMDAVYIDYDTYFEEI